MTQRIATTEREESLAELRKHFKPGDPVYLVLRHVARSGMSRTIGTVIFENGQQRHWDFHIARVLGLTFDRNRQGIKISGCGMDMGFELAYQLGRALFPEGFGIPMYHANQGGKGSPRVPKSRQQAEESAAKGYSAERGRNGDRSGWEYDGGYALKHHWL